MAVEFPDHPFWDFSLDVYQREGVGAACIELQERHGIDVNILLYCCWLGASGRGSIDADEAARLVAAADPWHQSVVRGLRAVRQVMKGGIEPVPIELSDPLRRRIAKIEVDCEHVEQLVLAAAVERPADETADPDRRAGDAVANIGRYFEAIGVRAGKRDNAPLLVILGTVFPAMGTERLESLCGSLESV